MFASISKLSDRKKRWFKIGHVRAVKSITLEELKWTRLKMHGELRGHMIYLDLAWPLYWRDTRTSLVSIQRIESKQKLELVFAF